MLLTPRHIHSFIRATFDAISHNLHSAFLFLHLHSFGYATNEASYRCNLLFQYHNESKNKIMKIKLVFN